MLEMVHPNIETHQSSAPYIVPKRPNEEKRSVFHVCDCKTDSQIVGNEETEIERQEDTHFVLAITPYGNLSKNSIHTAQ